jgi:hypothetical protein
LNGLHLDELDSGKLTYENTANTDALKEMEKLRTLAKLNQSFKFCKIINFSVILLLNGD